MIKFLSYGRQFIDEDDVDAVVSSLQGDYLTGGQMVQDFETALAEKVKAPYAIACSSGTAALHLASLAFGIGPGQVVIVPSITFAATANAVRYVSADVCFSDVDPQSGLMRPEDLERAIAQAKAIFPDHKIAAVYVVHLNGQTENLPALYDIAKAAGIKFLVDGSHALGTVYGTEKYPVGCCKHADCEIFSFHPVKTIAMGEGGAVCTADPAFARKITLLRSHGITRSEDEFTGPYQEDDETKPWYYEMQLLGFNYRVSDINCALALSQLKKLDRFKEARRNLVELYRSQADDLFPVIRPIKACSYSDACWHLMPFLFDFKTIGKTRAEVMKSLADKGIGSQVHYIPLYKMPYYQYYLQSLNSSNDIVTPGAEDYYRSVLSLPLHYHVSSEDVERIISTLKEWI